MTSKIFTVSYSAVFWTPIKIIFKMIFKQQIFLHGTKFVSIDTMETFHMDNCSNNVSGL